LAASVRDVGGEGVQHGDLGGGGSDGGHCESSRYTATETKNEPARSIHRAPEGKKSPTG
jgi:hypothetical protein